MRTVKLARRMVEKGAALAVMGNHEFNAIAWHTPDVRHLGEYLRPHQSPQWGDKNRKQHAYFLAEVVNMTLSCTKTPLTGSLLCHSGLTYLSFVSCMPAGMSLSWTTSRHG
jgi:hypothetical protein